MVDLNGDPGSCDVCGRSMLAGERTRTYLTRDREEREVCELCLVRAENAGWTSRELAGAPLPERREGGGAVRRLFGRARESAATLGRTATGDDSVPAPEPEPKRSPEPEPEPEPAPTRTRRRREAERAPRERPQRERPERERPQPERRPASAQADQQPEVPSEQRPRRRSVPQKPERRVRRAFESFNASEHPVTVRSLIRSLGGPYVCAVTTDEDPAIVRITVAWELSWYQYEVDLTSETEGARELGRGEELSQLAPEDQDWNAHAAEDGELRTGLVGSQADG